MEEAELCVLPGRVELWEGSSRSLGKGEKRTMKKQQVCGRLKPMF